jgi:hypothetical protein
MCNIVDGKSQEQETGGHNPPAGGLVALGEFEEVLGEVPEAG